MIVPSADAETSFNVFNTRHLSLDWNESMNSRDMKPENSRSDSRWDEQESDWNSTWNMTESRANWSWSRLLVTGAFF